MVTNKIRSQVLSALVHIAESLVICALCVYCSIGVYYNGAGTRSRHVGLRGLAADWLYKMEDQGNDLLVKGILFGIFGIAAVSAFVMLVYYLLHLTPGRTRLGRSIKKQAASYEKFRGLTESINLDMERESLEFGTELRIGTQWILADEVMRLNRVQGICVAESRKKHELTLTDRDLNQLSVSFGSKENLENAVRFLRKKLPDIPIEGLPEGFAAAAFEYPEFQTGETAGFSQQVTEEIRKMKALAIAAPLRMVQFEYEKELGAQNESPKKQAKMQKELAAKRKIENKEQLISKIETLYLGEKTAEHDALLSVCGLTGTDEKRDLLKRHGMGEDWQNAFFKLLSKAENLFREYGVYLPKPGDSLYAYELAEAAVLTVHGASAGYLTAGEEMERLLLTGRLAGLFYASWTEYAGAFLLGYFFDTFLQQSSPSHAEIYMAGKSEVKEIRRFLQDREFMACPFGNVDGGPGENLPGHYQPD